MLDEEFEYYLQNREQFIRQYPNKFIVIKGNKVLGAYDDKFDAIKETAMSEELGTFLVQLCSAENSSINQVFHSRLIFSRN